MEKKANRYITVAYQLYADNGNQPELVEEATADRPFRFMSGLGITIEGFENAIAPLETGGTFDFTLTPDQAYGEYMAERVLDLDKDMFCIDGKFDHEHIFRDAIVPLQNEDGNRFMGRVLDISDRQVKMDLNHPLAGKTLNFKGHVIESREATDQELQDFINHLNGHGCGGGCGNCGGDCSGDHKGGCGNCGDNCEGDCEGGCGGCHS